MADSDCFSENASCTHNEFRIRKLFQVCDANGDGYIDSQDLKAVCLELNIEDSLEELMFQLGADSEGRISYEQFLQRRLDLRPEIDALKCPPMVDTASDNSQGKVDSWEWDSGARDLSPVPQTRTAKLQTSESGLQSTLQGTCNLQLEEQAQRYEEQITELHSVIAELTRKLQQQKVLAIAEEDEGSELDISAVDDSVSGANERETSDTETKLPTGGCSGVARSTASDDSVESGGPSREEGEALRAEILLLRSQLASAAVVGRAGGEGDAPVAKMAERVRLRRAVEREECAVTNECRIDDTSRLAAQLEHVRAQNAVLAIALADTKEHCDRLSLLCGKYESNAVALTLALRLTDRAIEAYDVLLALLETESDARTIEDRVSAETVAFRLLDYLDGNVDGGSTTRWTRRHEARLRDHVSRLKQERAAVRNTAVRFESTHPPPAPEQIRTARPPLDIETAVLLQEMMALREERADLQARLTHALAERDKLLKLRRPPMCL